MSQPEIASAAYRAQVVHTVVAAFRDDPAFRYFFADRTRYPEHASAFVGRLFDRRVTRGTVWVVDGASAVAMWSAPPGEPPDDLSPDDLPADVLERLAAYDGATHALLPAEPHWYLGVLATHPDHAGRRLGRAVMAPGVRRARDDDRPAYLETTNPRNVRMYERSGWTVTGEATVDDLTIWVMRVGR